MSRLLSGIITMLCAIVLAIVLLAWVRSYLGNTLTVECYRGQLLFIGVEVSPEQLAAGRGASPFAMLVPYDPSSPDDHQFHGAGVFAASHGGAAQPAATTCAERRIDVPSAERSLHRQRQSKPQMNADERRSESS